MTNPWKVPMITYGTSFGTTLSFTYPPVMKAGDAAYWTDKMSAVRHDTTTISGRVQSIVERVEHLKVLTMENVPAADLPAWKAFMEVAILGTPFRFYPDSSDHATHDDYIVTDTEWAPLRAGYQLARFVINLKQVLPADAGS